MFRIFNLFLINLCFAQMLFAGQKTPINVGVLNNSHKIHPAMASANDGLSFIMQPLFKQNSDGFIECVQCEKHDLKYQAKNGILNATFTLGKHVWDHQDHVKCSDYFLSYSVIKFHLHEHPQRKFWQNIIMKPCDPLFPDKIQLKVRGRRWGLVNLLFYPTSSSQEQKLWSTDKKTYLKKSGYNDFKSTYLKNKGFYPSLNHTFNFLSFGSVFSMLNALKDKSISRTQAFSTKNLPNYTLNDLKKKHVHIKRHHANEHLVIGHNHRNDSISPEEISELYHEIRGEAKTIIAKNPFFFEESKFTNLLTTQKKQPKKTYLRRQLFASSSSYLKRKFFHLPNIQKKLRMNEVPPSQFKSQTSQIRYQDFTAYITKIEPWNELTGFAASRFTPTYFNDYRGSNIHAVQSVAYENILDTIGKKWEPKETQNGLKKAREMLVNDLKIYPFLAFKTISVSRK